MPEPLNEFKMKEELADIDTPDIYPIEELLSDANDVCKLYSLLSEESLTRLTMLLEGLLENASDALFEHAQNESEPIKLQAYFNTMRALKNSAEPMMSRFAELIELSWRDVGNVALFEIDDDAEGKAAEFIKRMSRKTHVLFAPLLADLAITFSQEEPISNYKHPLDPIVISRIFWASTDELKLSIKERLLVLPLFRRFVLDSYGQVLAPIREILRAL